MYAKSAIVLAWAVASWLLLVLGVPQSWWQACLLAVSLGLALAGVGFNITHDANHGSSAAFVAWSLAIPPLLHPAWRVAAVFGVVWFVLALTMAVTFHLAHCLEEAESSTVGEMTGAGRCEWARHQIDTTVDVAPRNRVLAWHLGGLNFQVEHHLFSRVRHTHHPAMAVVVREVRDRHGARHQSRPGLWSALTSHTRWVRRMGEKVAEPREVRPAT